MVGVGARQRLHTLKPQARQGTDNGFRLADVERIAGRQLGRFLLQVVVKKSISCVSDQLRFLFAAPRLHWAGWRALLLFFSPNLS